MYQPVNPDPIPVALVATPQWVCWREEVRDEKPTKIPIAPETGTYASVTDADTWTNFDTAYQSFRDNASLAGVGFVFTDADDYIGVDLDACRTPDTGKLEAWAKDIIRQLDSYTEASPSQTGVHIIATGDLPAGGNRNDTIELYADRRYFTVTGRHLSETPLTINDRTDELAHIHNTYIANDTADATTEVLPTDDTPVELPDDELIAYALNAANGDKFERLWRGDTSSYPSHSEADQALCNLLAFWTGGDPYRIERLFNQSGLVREKWQEREDYRERTIKNAIRDCPAYYNP